MPDCDASSRARAVETKVMVGDMILATSSSKLSMVIEYHVVLVLLHNSKDLSRLPTAS